MLGLLWVVLVCGPVDAAQEALQLRVGELLSQTDRADDPTVLGRRIAGFGSETLPTVFDCLRDGQYTLAGEEGPVQEPLSIEQENALLEALRETSASSVVEFLRSRTTEAPTQDNRRTALRVLAIVARSKELSFCMQLAEPIDETSPVDYGALEHLLRCLEKIFTDSKSSLRSVRTVFERAHPEVQPTIIRAVGKVGTELGLRALAEILGLQPRLDSFILSSMGRVATKVALPMDEAIVRRVRGLEKSVNPTLARESLLLLGRFEDAESVDRMIARLSDEDRSIRRAAHWALRHLSGLGLREEPRRWSMWHEGEAQWCRERAPEVLSWLRSPDVKEKKSAIAILSHRRLRRHELAFELTPLLIDQDESIVVLAASALAILDARGAIPELLEQLNHRSAAVRTSVRAALGKLGADLPSGD